MGPVVLLVVGGVAGNPVGEEGPVSGQVVLGEVPEGLRVTGEVEVFEDVGVARLVQEPCPEVFQMGVQELRSPLGLDVGDGVVETGDSGVGVDGAGAFGGADVVPEFPEGLDVGYVGVPEGGLAGYAAVFG